MSFLLACALLFQDKSAADTLLRITEKVEKATTIHARLRSETVATDSATGKETRIVHVCTLAVIGPDQVLYESEDDSARMMRLFVGGGLIVLRIQHPESYWELGSDVVRRRLLQAFGRGGGVGVLGWLEEPWVEPANKGPIGVGRRLVKPPKPEGKAVELRATDPQWGGEGIIRYVLRIDDAALNVELAINPKTLQPIKRVVTIRTADSTVIRTESYLVYEVDQGLSDDQFAELTGETPAGRALRKIETAIRDAHTIRVKFSSTVPKPTAGRVDLPPMNGEILLKEGYKTKLTLEGDAAGPRPQKQTIVCDGKKISGEFAHFEQVKNPARVFHEMLRAVLGRPGIQVGTFALAYGLAFRPPGDVPDPDFNDVFEIGSLAEGEPDQGAHTLIFRLEGGIASDVKVWYDPKEFRILKRQITPSGGASYLEIYDEFTLNKEIPDEEFKGSGK